MLSSNVRYLGQSYPWSPKGSSPFSFGFMRQSKVNQLEAKHAPWGSYVMLVSADNVLRNAWATLPCLTSGLKPVISCHDSCCWSQTAESHARICRVSQHTQSVLRTVFYLSFCPQSTVICLNLLHIWLRPVQLGVKVQPKEEFKNDCGVFCSLARWPGNANGKGHLVAISGENFIPCRVSTWSSNV